MISTRLLRSAHTTGFMWRRARESYKEEELGGRHHYKARADREIQLNSGKRSETREIGGLATNDQIERVEIQQVFCEIRDERGNKFIIELFQPFML